MHWYRGTLHDQMTVLVAGFRKTRDQSTTLLPTVSYVTLNLSCSVVVRGDGEDGANHCGTVRVDYYCETFFTVTVGLQLVSETSPDNSSVLSTLSSPVRLLYASSS